MLSDMWLVLTHLYLMMCKAFPSTPRVALGNTIDHKVLEHLRRLDQQACNLASGPADLITILQRHLVQDRIVGPALSDLLKP